MSSNNPNRVIRSGSWINAPVDARVASRLWLAPGSRFVYLGVRLIREITVLVQLAEVKDAK